jgi:hypothetical protein
LINVTWTVNNDSLVAANGYWLDAVYLSSDAVLDENDTGASYYRAGPLNAKSTYSLDAFFSVPYISSAGQYYLIFSADSFGEQAETDESNNDLALPINLDLNGPDLQLLSASAPTSASLGSPITVSWTVKNQGVAAASNNWWDAIYLSIDAILDENDVYANQYANDAHLAADSSYSRSLTFSIPSISTAGQYYILFSTDDYGQQGETDESNNHLAVPINLDLNGPDLQLLSASAPASASAGSPITVSWTVKNQGAATASNDWSDVIYLSKDDVYNDSDTYVAGFSAADQSPLAAGGSYTQTKTISATGIDTAAQYYLIFRTNSSSYSGQAEISKANNDLAIPINLDLNGPDLQLVSASAPASASVGSSITVSWTVKNQGVATASNDWSDDVYLSKDSRYDYSDTFLTRSNAADQSPLAAGSSYTQTTTISAPSIDAAGQHYLIFRTNPYSFSYPEQVEISKANNDLAIPISLDLNGPDLQLVSASAPASASVGSSITVSWTVKNQGAATASNDWVDYVYLSKDNVYDYSDAYLAGSNAADQSPLAAGSSYTQTTTISAPSIDAAGQHYLIFRTNPYSNPWQPEQLEISKANNDLAIPISLDLKVPDPVVTLAVSPSSVAEDGSSNIIYTFSRSGDTSNGLSVYYALGGTATPGIDYTGIAATWTPFRSVSFAAGTASATITVDPTVDSEIEPDETIELSLYPGYGYSIGTTAWVVGTILNAAPSTTIDLFGNTRLLNRGDGKAFVEFGPGPGPIPGMRKEISSPWNSPVGNEFSEWQMLAAETIAGNNQILLRNNTYNFLHTWTLDANWNWQSSSGADAFNSPGAWWLESSFQVDANRDWIIGPPFWTPTPMSLP